MILQDFSDRAMNIGKAVLLLSKAYIALAENKIPFKSFPSVMLWGSPGVGKSQGVKQIADRISKSTKKEVKVTDVRLLLFNPVDLRGIPTANADKTLAVWLKPQIFQMDASDDVINILFLDEISAAPPSVQAAAYQITLDRTVGEHKLPENCIVIAAGNRVTDRSVAFNMPKALANRLCHIEICSDADSWYQWAISAGVNSKVLGFLKTNPDFLMQFKLSEGDNAFPTPRSWEMVSNILNNISPSVSEMFELIAGCIGWEVAADFQTWCDVFGTIPAIEDIFSGKTQETPVHPEGLFAITSDIVVYAKEHHSREEISNVLAYVSMLPKEFRNSVFADLLSVEGIHSQLQADWDYNFWFERSGRDWEDYGL